MTKNEILFIDDEEAICEVAKRMLGRDDFSVTTFPSGEQVVDALSQKKPSLVFLDLNLPGQNGLEILKNIRAVDAQIPVVMVSAFMNSDHAVRAARLGVTDYILKPVDWGYLRNIAHLYSLLSNTRA
jgi:DNA-binding NtrC family response regulator